MNKKYKKEARVAMAVALATTSIAHSAGNLFAQSEETINENTLIDVEEVKEENIEIESLESKVEEVVEESLESKESIQHIGKAVGDVTIDATNFPDSTFRNYISTNFDTNNNGILSSDEIANIIRIDVNGNQNITSVQGIEFFSNLTYLDCANTGIKSLNVRNNPALIYLYCFNIGITSIDVTNNTALKEFWCYDTGITNLDVTKNLELTWLDCSNRGLTSIDLKKNTKLTRLHINGTQITNLDVSNNLDLRILYCNSNSRLSFLDLDNNTKLTGLSFVDLNNTLLSLVYHNKLAWIHIGENSKVSPILLMGENSTIDLGGVGSTFNIIDKFPGIDVNRITIRSGATLDKATGIVSGYTLGIPIKYTYNCGTYSDSNHKLDLNVTLTFKGLSSVIIHDNLNKVYDGQAVVNPINITKAGSTGAVSFEWYTANGTKLSTAPTGAGDYKVKAILAEDNQYVGAEVEKAFTITKANSTIDINEDLNKVYDGQIVADPTNIIKTGSSGVVSFEWYTLDDTKLQSAPANAGNYKVKAILAEDRNYVGAESERSFEITKASSTIAIHDNLNKVYDGTVVVDPTNITTTGSNGAISFEWYTQEGVLLQGAPMNTGNYKVKAILADDANYIGADVEKEFTITKANSSITIDDRLDKVYYGTAVVDPTNISTTGSSGSVSFEWYTADGVKLGSAPREAGNYKVKAILADDANHIGAEVEKAFTIGKAASIITINDDLNKVYDGQAIVEPANLTKIGSNGAVSFEWYTADGTQLQTAPTEVGNYKVKAILAEDGNYVGAEVEKAFTITKANSSITINDRLDKVYDGQAVIEPANLTKIGSNGAVTFEWYKVDGTQLQAAPIEVGSYKVKAILASDGNYVGAESEKSFEITKASSSIIINDDLNKVYDGQAVVDPANITITGSNGTVSFEWYTADGTQLQTAPTDAGSYKVKAILAENVNYVGAEVEKSFEIAKASSTITIHDDLNKVYDGQAVVDPANITKIGSNGAVSFEWYTANDTKLQSAPMNVGSYKVKAILASDVNYVGAEVEKAFEITKANSSITINDSLDKVYDGQAVMDPVNLTTTGSNGTVSFEWYTADDTKLQSAPVNVGSYKVKAILASDVNYVGAEVEKAFEIAKANSTITIHDDLNKAYDGQPVLEPSVTTTGSTGAVTFEWYTADGTKLATAPVNAGSYKVKAILADDANHIGAEVEETFAITKANSTITINDDLNKIYDGTEAVEPTDIVTTGSTGTVTFEWYTVDGTKLATAPVNAGSYKVKAILAEDTNYAGAEVEKEFTITKASSTIAINGDLNKAYDAKAVVEPQVTTIGSTGIVIFEWYTADGTLLISAPVNVGSYKVKAILADDANHIGAEVEKEFTITKAASNIVITVELNKVYDGQPVSEPQVSVTGSTGAITYEWYKKEESTTKAVTWTKLATAPIEVGNYKVVVTVAGDGNFVTTTVEKEFSILDKEVVPTPGTGGIIINPDGTVGPVVNPDDKVESNGPVITNPDGSITFPNGGTIIKPDGSVVIIQPGAILKPNEESTTIPGVQTGDGTQVGLWTMLVGLSTGIMMFFRRKNRKEEV